MIRHAASGPARGGEDEEAGARGYLSLAQAASISSW